MCAYSVFNTFPVYPLSAKPLILLAFCRYRYHTSLLELPVFYDLEDADGWKERNGYVFSGDNATAQCRAWIQNIGLQTGVYASYSWLERAVTDSGGRGGGPIDWRTLDCSVWNAEWGGTDDIRAFVWQDTDQLPIGGRLVDGNWMYADYLFSEN